MKHDDFNTDKMTARYEDAEHDEPDRIDDWNLVGNRVVEHYGWFNGEQFTVRQNQDTGELWLMNNDWSDAEEDALRDWLEGKV